LQLKGGTLPPKKLDDKTTLDLKEAVFSLLVKSPQGKQQLFWCLNSREDA